MVYQSGLLWLGAYHKLLQLQKPVACWLNVNLPFSRRHSKAPRFQNLHAQLPCPRSFRVAGANCENLSVPKIQVLLVCIFLPFKQTNSIGCLDLLDLN